MMGLWDREHVVSNKEGYYMKIAVFSDIHSNYIAFQTCLEYVLEKGIDTFIFLGDYLGEMAYPQRTMEILYSLQEKYNCIFVRGNKEEYWIGYEAGGETGWEEGNSTTGMLHYSYHHMTKKDMDFFKSMPHTKEVVFEDLLPLTICHGSPRRVNELLFPDKENTQEVMDMEQNAYLLSGHTHVQYGFEYNGKHLLNPGAVGSPLNSDGKTQFMILYGTADAWDYEFVSLDYDVEKVIAQMHEAGLPQIAPYWCKVTEPMLRTGKISHGKVLGRAMQICTEKYGECIWPNVPDECYEQAIRELIRE